jgi:hypothetical protein
VTLEPDKTVESVQCSSKQSIWQLMIQIGKKFNMRITEFDIISKSGTVSRAIFDNPVGQYNLTTMSIVRQDIKILNSEHPRRVMAQNVDFIKCLIQMLTSGDQLWFKNEVLNLIESLPVNLKLKNDFVLQITNFPNQTDSKDAMEPWCKLYFWDPKYGVDARTFHMLTLL